MNNDDINEEMQDFKEEERCSCLSFCNRIHFEDISLIV
jgi:hypothetical protein